MGIFALAAAAGFAFYGVIRELQPVFLAAIQFTGIAIIILICAGSLCVCLIVIFLFTGNNNSPGAMIAHELIEQRRINKLNRIILSEKLAARRQELRQAAIEIDYHTPDIMKEGRFYS
jgi:hypothetical protein